jgi:preprotein translocase subunit SecD
MLEFARWKYIVAALVLVIATVYSLPNLFPQDSAVQISANRGNVVDTALRERVQGVLEAGKIGFKRIDLEGDSLLVRLADPNAQIHAADAVRAELGNGYVVALNLASTVPEWLSKIGAKPMSLGLDLQGGVHFMMEVDERGALEKRENGFHGRHSLPAARRGCAVQLGGSRRQRDRGAPERCRHAGSRRGPDRTRPARSCR